MSSSHFFRYFLFLRQQGPSKVCSVSTRWMRNQIPHPTSSHDRSLNKNIGRYVKNTNTKVVFFFFPPKLIILFYYYNYYFIILTIILLFSLGGPVQAISTTSKFKEKFWCEENLAVNRKLRYCTEVNNSNLEDQKYLSVVTSSQKTIYIATIRMNSHELHSETGHWPIPKTPWAKRVYHLCESMSIEDENHFLLECLAYIHIRSKIHSICYNANLYSLLTFQNYSQLGELLGKLFEHRKYYPSEGPIDQTWS